MNTNLSHLKNLRIYQHLPFVQLVSHLVCNRVMQSKLLVDGAPLLYRWAKYFPGKTITNWIIGQTFNKMFTGGHSFEELKQASAHLMHLRIPLMIDFCAQGIADDPKGEEILDENAKKFALSAVFSAGYPNFLFSIKLSGLVDMNVLQKYNRSVLLRDKLWSQSCQNGLFVAERCFDSFQKIYGGVSEQDFVQYLKLIHGFNGENVSQFLIDEVQFKLNHHPYYLNQPDKNNLLLIKLLFPLDNRQKQCMYSLERRLGDILDVEYRNDHHVKVLVDAEQSYVQRAVQSLTEQIQVKYNKQRLYIIPTLQNYLERAQSRVEFQLEIAKRRNLFFGVKLVRGAYLVQETRLAKEGNYKSPVESCFENTTQNYLSNFKKIICSGLKGQVFLAGHNENTIKDLLQIKEGLRIQMKINFAQLYGLGDHLTILLRRRGQTVYKLLPWAETEVMVPYMIRRAEQLSQMRYPLKTQRALLMHQLRFRMFSF